MSNSSVDSAGASKGLSVERLFSEPALGGELPSHIKFSADGNQIAWLQIAEDNRERLDLWLYDVAGGTVRLALDARVAGQDGILSDTEKAERERRRQFTSGVTNFHWHPDNAQIAAEIDGLIYLLTPATGELLAVTPEGSRQTNLKFSPDGLQLAFVRDYNLWLYDLTNNTQRQFTSDGNALRHYGLQEFIAQEEMHRFDGYWWSDDSSALIYTRVDNSTVAVSQRYEIDADQFRVIEQRYPYAGERDARVELALHPLQSTEPRWINWSDNPDDYLARVNCSSGSLYVQSQHRSQQQLTLKRWALDDVKAAPSILLTETSSTWLNLHDNFSALPDGSFVWTSARSGYEHLYLYRASDLQTPIQLTSGRGRVNNVLHLNNDAVLFSGWMTEPTQSHLYRCQLHSDAGESLQALTAGEGWHDVSVADSGNVWVDRHSNFELPAELSLGTLDQAGNPTTRVIKSLGIDAAHPYAPYRSAHVTPQMGQLPGLDGEPLYYRLTEPAAKQAGKQYPVVVYVYGGPGGARVNWAWPPLLLQLFAQAGIGVLELDNRGTGNRSTAFDDPIYLRMGDAEVADQIEGVRFLKSLPWVDPERLGVWGHSYGGYMTVMCMCQANEVFKAGVSIAPVSDWTLYDTHYTERFLSTPQSNSAGYAASAVFPYLKDLQGKLLLIHGMADDNVLFTHSTKLYKALQDLDKPFQMMTYPGSKHALHERSVSIHPPSKDNTPWPTTLSCATHSAQTSINWLNSTALTLLRWKTRD